MWYLPTTRTGLIEAITKLSGYKPSRVQAIYKTQMNKHKAHRPKEYRRRAAIRQLQAIYLNLLSLKRKEQWN